MGLMMTETNVTVSGTAVPTVDSFYHVSGYKVPDRLKLFNNNFASVFVR